MLICRDWTSSFLKSANFIFESICQRKQSTCLWWGLIGASVACWTTTLGSFFILFSLLCWYQALYTRNPLLSFLKPLYFLWKGFRLWHDMIKVLSYFFLIISLPTTGIPSSLKDVKFSLRGICTLYWLGESALRRDLARAVRTFSSLIKTCWLWSN